MVPCLWRGATYLLAGLFAEPIAVWVVLRQSFGRYPIRGRLISGGGIFISFKVHRSHWFHPCCLPLGYTISRILTCCDIWLRKQRLWVDHCVIYIPIIDIVVARNIILMLFLPPLCHIFFKKCLSGSYAEPDCRL